MSEGCQHATCQQSDRRQDGGRCGKPPATQNHQNEEDDRRKGEKYSGNPVSLVGVVPAVTKSLPATPEDRAWVEAAKHGRSLRRESWGKGDGSRAPLAFRPTALANRWRCRPPAGASSPSYGSKRRT